MIEFKDVSFRYQGSEQANSLRHIDLQIPDGQVVLLCGRSGCGKTSLTRLINGIIPHYFAGELSGEVLLHGKNIAEQPIYETARSVGSVFQNPRSQFFNVDSTGEAVFACENMGWPAEKIGERLAQVTREWSLAPLLGRNLFHLSGGEKQKIACASVTMYDPEVMVLDEPTSNLDIRSIRMLADIIRAWKRSGKTVLVAEHRLHYLASIADRVIYMEDGQIAEDMPAREFFEKPPQEIAQMGLRALTSVDFCQMPPPAAGSGTLELSGFHFSYRNTPTLDIPSMSVPVGAVVGILGSNGAGKTTFARCLCGLLRKARGTVFMDGAAWDRRKRLRSSYLVMQDVNHQLFTESVEEEVLIGMPGREAENTARAEKALSDLDLLPFKELHPLSLSGGQKQRVAIAAAVASQKELLVFDEPTSGLDYFHMMEAAKNIRDLSARGKTVFLITHDPELIAACCNFFLFFERGSIQWSGGATAENREKLRTFFSAEGKADGR